MEIFSGEVFGILLFFLGLIGLMTEKKVIKSIMILTIMQAGVYLVYITTNYTNETVPPIVGEGDPATFADPVPSALMITAIVIGIGITAIGLTMFMHYAEKHDFTHWSRIRHEDDDDED